MSFDNVCKILAERYPTDFARWLLSDEPQQIEVLKAELSIEPIRADSVIFLRTENRILHLEFKTTEQSDTPIPLQILDYFVKLVQKYDVPITQVVVFLKQTPSEIAFTEAYVNEMTTHRYRVIRMWEQDSAFFLNNPALLPLAPLAQTNSPQSLLSQVAQSVAKISDKVTRQNTAEYTKILAGLRFDKDLIHKLSSEEIMKQSAIYQEFLQKGEQREALRFCMLLLDECFIDVNPSILERIKVLNTEKLEALGVMLLRIVAIDDLFIWLDQHESN